MRSVRNIVFPSLLSTFIAVGAVAPAFAAGDAAWKKADEMPDVAIEACAAEVERKGYSISEVLGGREIDRYVDLRYKLARASGDELTAVCRYDSARKKASVKPSRSVAK